MRRALPRHERIRALKGWTVAVVWDEHRIRGTLTRGELVIPSAVRGNPWWSPVARTRAMDVTDRLATVLAGYAALYAAADPTGRMRVEAWREGERLGLAPWEGAERVKLVLEPGVRLGGEAGQGTRLFHRLGDHVGLGVEGAVRDGWVGATLGR
ncbi:MAG TPA: hypothetical protein VGR37_20095 [Longimicrobiaceae bacterium]|nr:hypothetical protein [Longimicrobiaceae bacterium]